MYVFICKTMYVNFTSSEQEKKHDEQKNVGKMYLQNIRVCVDKVFHPNIINICCGHSTIRKAEVKKKKK